MAETPPTPLWCTGVWLHFQNLSSHVYIDNNGQIYYTFPPTTGGGGPVWACFKDADGHVIQSTPSRVLFLQDQFK